MQGSCSWDEDGRLGEAGDMSLSLTDTQHIGSSGIRLERIFLAVMSGGVRSLGALPGIPWESIGDEPVS